MDKHTELQKQWEVLSTKIRGLRKAIATETNPTHKLNYETDLEEAEKERSELEKKIEFVQEDRIILNLKGSKNEVHCVFKDRVIIGRSPTCGFWIDDDSNQISKLHAVIFYKLETNEYWIEDLKSINGTYVDNEKIEHPTQLLLGTRIRLGSSFSFLFEHNPNDPLSVGVIIQHDSDGEELKRYIIVPKGRVNVGTNTNEVVRFTKFREAKTLGSLIKKADGFYFRNINNEEILLKHNSELTLDFLPIRIIILNIVSKTTLDETYAIDDDLENTLHLEKEIKRPPEDAVPPYIRKLNIFLGIVALSVTAIFHFTLFNPSPDKVHTQWIDECLIVFQNKNNKHWRIRSQASPSSVKVILIQSLSDKEMIWDFINRSALSKKIEQDETLYLTHWEFMTNFRLLKQENSNSFWITIEEYNFLGYMSLKITYWHPNSYFPAFYWERKKFLYLPSTLILLLTVFISRLIQDRIINKYRNTLQKEYEDFDAKRTKKIFDAELSLDEARQLAQRGELAKALTITNRLLKSISKSMPVYKEIVDLRKIVQAQINSGGGSITVESLPGMSSNFPISTDASRLLYLRILGTPYAYQAPYGLKTITIGRQRRKQGVSASIGNDVIIRVPGSDEKSLKISRRHLEIKQIDTEYFVIDKSGGRTKLNGKVISENQPYRLQPRDRLTIADVLILEVLIRVNVSGIKTNNVIRIDDPNQVKEAFLIEASIGDMVTEVFDD